MPITRPCRSTSAPPLLPGLIDADVWMTLGSVAPGDSADVGSLTVRPSADTIPLVTVADSPSGLPIASTISPTSAWEESPKLAGSRSDPSATRITAMSLGW